jgi:hypothetical protein
MPTITWAKSFHYCYCVAIDGFHYDSVTFFFQANNGRGSMQGLTMKSLKHHVALQPLFVIIGAGMVFVGAYVFRSLE